MISVVIPTRDRRAALAETLDRLAHQRLADGDTWEVVLVDNGCSDGTGAWAREQAAGYPVALRVLHEPRPGPAVARNTGTWAAQGDVVLFLGDDMAPAEEGLLRGHVALHAQRPEERYAVLGRATWRPDRQVTQFMRWLEHGGPQFQFHRLTPGPVDPSLYLYTPNISMKRSLLRRIGGFDERFPFAATEDVELGVRLRDIGLVLDYHPELVVLHDHPTTLADSLARMGKVGRSGALFITIHPHREHPGAPVPRGVRWRLFAATTPVARRLAGDRVPLPIRRRAWEVLHMNGYARGFREGPPTTS